MTVKDQLSVTVLTPTGNRHIGIKLLGQYIRHQKYSGPVKWVFIDDGDPKTEIPSVPENWVVECIFPSPKWCPGQNTQSRNLLDGLDFVSENDRVLVFEDDDFVGPDYLQTMIDALDDYDLVGERVSRYYNVRSGRYKEMRGSGKHASLMCTAMKGPAIEAFRKACEVAPRYIDMVLWRDFKGKKNLLESRNTVGIKGLPGRAGIGVGHKSHFGNLDDGTVLREWLGDYADNY